MGEQGEGEWTLAGRQKLLQQVYGFEWARRKWSELRWLCEIARAPERTEEACIERLKDENQYVAIVYTDPQNAPVMMAWSVSVVERGLSELSECRQPNESYKIALVAVAVVNLRHCSVLLYSHIPTTTDPSTMAARLRLENKVGLPIPMLE